MTRSGLVAIVNGQEGEMFGKVNKILHAPLNTTAIGDTGASNRVGHPSRVKAKVRGWVTHVQQQKH